MNKIYRTVYNETTNTWVAVVKFLPLRGKATAAM